MSWILFITSSSIQVHSPHVCQSLSHSFSVSLVYHLLIPRLSNYLTLLLTQDLLFYIYWDNIDYLTYAALLKPLTPPLTELPSVLIWVLNKEWWLIQGRNAPSPLSQCELKMVLTATSTLKFSRSCHTCSSDVSYGLMCAYVFSSVKSLSAYVSNLWEVNTFVPCAPYQVANTVVFLWLCSWPRHIWGAWHSIETPVDWQPQVCMIHFF